MTIIAGNWKMNGSKTMLDQWFVDFEKEAKQYDNAVKESVNVLICVPDLYIEYATAKALNYNKNIKNFKVNIGAEDVHYEDKGAFTGSTSPLFLKEFNCLTSLIGHSERRIYQGETDEIVAKKSANALKNSITPIICVGETLEVRESNKYLVEIEKQVLTATSGLDLNKVVIAYEPVWAIGTGKVPTTQQIEEIGAYIKKILKKQDLQVLYGGSVKGDNAKDILSLNSIDGVLVGGASMKGVDFFSICKGLL